MILAGKCQFSAIWPAGWRSDFAGFSGGTGSCKCHQPLQTPNPNPSHPQPPLAPEIHKPVQLRRPPSPDSVSATMLLNSLIVSKTRWCYHHVFSNLPSLWSRNVLWSQIALFWTIGIPAPISTCLENILSFLMEYDGPWTMGYLKTLNLIWLFWELLVTNRKSERALGRKINDGCFLAKSVTF